MRVSHEDMMAMAGGNVDSSAHLPGETLRLSVESDPVSGLPLISERNNIFELVTAYLRLPYSIAEYGCGKRCSIIIDQLMRLGIAPQAMKRGLIMERDMSPSALAQSDVYLRPHAMLARNPFFDRVDFHDRKLLAFLEEHGARIDTDRGYITFDTYTLCHKPKVSFEIARSHVFLLLSFWDPSLQEVVERVVDPTLDEYEVFPVSQLRRKVAAFESVIFTGELTERFRIRGDLLTRRQKAELDSLCASRGVALGSLSESEEMEIVRIFLGAETASIGDPATWTYANNIPGFSGNAKADTRHDAKQQYITEIDATAALPGASQNQIAIISADARWAEKKLLPLSRLANLVSYYHARNVFCHALHEGQQPSSYLDDEQMLYVLQGLGISLEERINTAADVSRRSDAAIDARTFSPGFLRVSCELIRQMNELDMLVFVDAVGNLHGVFCSQGERAEAVQSVEALQEICGRSLCFMSHIDTVEDGGRYDGRLGVFSGLAIVSLLKEVYASEASETVEARLRRRPIMVTAYCNEEMTFTGKQISMPGSAAVSGFAAEEDIRLMQDAEGRVYGQCLDEFFSALSEKCQLGELAIANLSGEKERSIPARVDPTSFYSPLSYERHIEQGPVLDREGVPLVLVKGIRGIRQEDFTISGPQAAQAALELNLRLRELQLQQDPADSCIRVTAGMLNESEITGVCAKQAMRLTFVGEANHAGATLLEDRRDAGVAAARYLRFIREQMGVGAEKAAGSTGIVAGDISFLPGSGRNSIPGEVSLSIAATEDADLAAWSEALEAGERFIEDVLRKATAEGGEGVRAWTREPGGLAGKAEKLVMSADIRFKNYAVQKAFLDAVSAVAREIEDTFDVQIERSIEQEAEPIELTETGQLLQIERSYGGSHNPNEAMLLFDLLRGLLFQFDVAYTMQTAGESSEKTVFQTARELLSRFGKYADLDFSSGALHDTCNIALRSRQSG